MKTVIKNGRVYSAANECFEDRDLFINGALISEPFSEKDTNVIDASGLIVAPGLVDIHTHGRAGYDFTSAGRDGLQKMARSYLESGVTTLMPTLASAPFDTLTHALDLIYEYGDSEDSARFIGAHLEGRYLNPSKRGAHSLSYLAKPDMTELSELLTHMPVPCRISAAFELDLSGDFTSLAKKHGATLSLAHTLAGKDEALLAFKRGVNSVTHLFNAMPSLHHRDGASTCAALTDSSVFTEIICDGIHICPDMIKLAFMCKGPDKLCLITDSMEATGCPDGAYSIAGQRVNVKNSIALTEDGALAGSTLSLLNAVENLSRFADIPLEIALKCATLTPAKAANIDNFVGSLDIGKSADVIFIDDLSSLKIKKIIKSGKPVK